MASLRADSRASTAYPGDDHPMADGKPSYKSWKKKYRKMRLDFDLRMQDSEQLHQLEQKAMRTAKRLAMENDRLMDLLLDINERPQMPLDKRMIIDGEKDAGDELSHPRSLSSLAKSVPHQSYASLIDQMPDLKEDLDPTDADIHPTSFVTADDLDDYLYELDKLLERPSKSTLAPSARGIEKPNPSINFALRNPTSVYNWLRKHAPKTFLQDLEKDKEKEKRKERANHENGDKDDKKRKSTGARANKRQSGVSRKGKDKEKEKEKTAKTVDSMAYDSEVSHDVPAETLAGAAKGKRKRGDDTGYRPKGGASRPSKKRKSGGGETKSRKSTGD